MRRYRLCGLLLGIFNIVCNVQHVAAQQLHDQDSVIQFFGVLLDANTRAGIPDGSVFIKGSDRGTFTNRDGVFSIVASKGDVVIFYCIGFKKQSIRIPPDLKEKQFTVTQMLVPDTTILPSVLLKPTPTREEFERDFATLPAQNDAYDRAQQNLDPNKMQMLLSTLPGDARESVNYQLRQQAAAFQYAGQLPPMDILNPLAWYKLIQSWKQGSSKSTQPNNTRIDGGNPIYGVDDKRTY